MTDDPWPQEVKDFYNDLSLDSGPLETVAQLHEVGLQVRRWKCIAAGLAVACAVVVTASAIVLNHAGNRAESTDIVDSKPSTAEGHDLHDNDKGTNTDPPFADQPRPGFDLIAVRLHKDWCGKCKQMGNVFAEIQHDLNGRRILFVTYDLTSDVTTKQSLLLGEILRIKPPLEELESGNIALLTPDGEFIELLDGTSGRRNLTSRIAMRL